MTRAEIAELWRIALTWTNGDGTPRTPHARGIHAGCRMSEPEPSLVPPGHGEPGPVQNIGRRCPLCSGLVQNVRPATTTAKEPPAWLGYCPDHGTVRLQG